MPLLLRPPFADKGTPADGFLLRRHRTIRPLQRGIFAPALTPESGARSFTEPSELSMAQNPR
jgi:hypothetical protein